MKKRNGAIVVLTAIMLTVIMVFIALAIDIGWICSAKTELQKAADAAAFAAGMDMHESFGIAKTNGVKYAELNGPKKSLSKGDIEFGIWDSDTKTLDQNVDKPDAVRVTLRRSQGRKNSVPLFFGPLLGKEDRELIVTATAQYRPRDIVLSLDFSGSMNDDSEIKSRNDVTEDLERIWNELGIPTYGDLTRDTKIIEGGTDFEVMEQLNLVNTPYPYSGGSWEEYVYYMEVSGDIEAAGYRYHYNILTFINYLMDEHPSFADTPVLWQTTPKPITSLKSSTDVFMDYLREVPSEDHVGLVIYSSEDKHAILEHSLTSDLDLISDTVYRRQAGHYSTMTNIGAGIQEAREELEINGRRGTAKFIVLMTDGMPNIPGNAFEARDFALEEAAICAQNKYPIVTISLGRGADSFLMSQIAEMTGGKHFHISPGEVVGEYHNGLIEVFREIADDRPLMLVE